MKRIISAIVVIALSTVALHGSAQTAKRVQATNKKETRKYAVGERTLQQFTVDFPGAADVSSTRNGTISEISFYQNNILYRAYYDMDNSLIGTITDKQVSDLPEAALKAIGKNHPGYTITKVIFFADNEANDTDMLLYGRQFADADNYFAELVKNGKTIVLQIAKDGSVLFFKSL